jgi:hypothetical protein
MVNCGSITTNFRVCIGDWSHRCPVTHTAFFGCGTRSTFAADALCSVSDDRTTTVFPSQIISQDSKGGGACGYSWFRVICRP